MLHQTLLDIFGYPAFRDGQEPVIRALLDGRPALAVFPTGGGKSLCYRFRLKQQSEESLNLPVSGKAF